MICCAFLGHKWKRFYESWIAHGGSMEQISMTEMFCVKCKKKVTVDDKNVKR